MDNKIVIHTNIYSSKNSRTFTRLKNGMTILAKPSRIRKMEKELDIVLKAYKDVWMRMIENKKYPLRVGFYIYRGDRRRWDWQNIIQGLADALVRNKYIEDDNASMFTPVYMGWDIDKDDPRAEIHVL